MLVNSFLLVHVQLDTQLQLLLENYVDGKTRELAGSWTIVDIDNWLQGNEFWAKAKVHRKQEEDNES